MYEICLTNEIPAMGDVESIVQKPFVDMGKVVIAEEIRALQSLASRLDNSFIKACDLLYTCPGRIVVMGVGKSGHIARKIAATFASTGSPSFFVHPTEASHGDLGMITANDVVVAISNSGQTQELLQLLPALKRLAVPLIAMTGNSRSLLAQHASVVLDIHVDKEACPLELAPTSSTTVTLVLGDALAIALLQARGFTKEDFAKSHPGGKLGKQLLIHIRDVMRVGDKIPKVSPKTSIRDVLIEMSRINLGVTAVVDPNNGQLLGIFSDGDLRRMLDKGLSVQDTLVESVMSRGGITVLPQQLAAEALKIMESRHIHALIVVDEERRVVGAFNIHDLFYHGVM